MSAQQIMYSQGARERLLRGIDKLAHAVRVTLGPRGRNVMLERSWGAPTVTKDGVTVAREIALEEKSEASSVGRERRMPNAALALATRT